MDESHIERVAAEYREHYPALISIEQAMAIAGVPRATLYDWSSRGLLDAIKVRRGRRLLLARDGFLRWLLSESENG